VLRTLICTSDCLVRGCLRRSRFVPLSSSATCERRSRVLLLSGAVRLRFVVRTFMVVKSIDLCRAYELSIIWLRSDEVDWHCLESVHMVCLSRPRSYDVCTFVRFHWLFL